MYATASDTAVGPVKNCRPRYFACHFGLVTMLVDVAAPDDCQVMQCGTASRAERKPPLHARHHSNVSLTENISCVIAYVLVTSYSNLGTSPQFVKQTVETRPSEQPRIDNTDSSRMSKSTHNHRETANFALK
jgi:hypothetical protein